jgi:hypothetical protein
MSIRLSTGAFEAILSTGSFQSVFAEGVICVYSGTQPANADLVETGDLLCTINVDGGVFTPGGGVGLEFDAASGKTISKAAAQTWTGSFAQEGTAGWFRFYDNDKVTGASTSAIRFDGSVGTSRSDIIVATTAATVGGAITLDSFTLNFSALT